jgi:hypothetical protein
MFSLLLFHNKISHFLWLKICLVIPYVLLLCVHTQYNSHTIKCIYLKYTIQKTQNRKKKENIRCTVK